MNQESLIPLLQSVLAPDTDRVKEATATLKKDYYKDPQSLALLIQILMNQDVANDVRQLAATQARTLVPKHWNAVPDSNKPAVRQHLLESTLKEDAPLVRHNSARVVAAIAKIDSEDGQWADLPELMVKISSSDDAKQREVGTYVLFTILETMADESQAIFGTLFQLFSKTIHDPQSAEVRINTLLALSKMALVLDADENEEWLAGFQKALPDMVAVLKQVIDAKDEERTLQAFEVFQTLIDCDPRLLNKHFGDLVHFMAEAASEQSLDKDARAAALNYLISCVMYRKLKFQGLRVGDNMIERMVKILFEVDDYNSDDDESTIGMSAVSMIGLMAQQLPPSQAVVPALKLFKQFAGSNTPKERYVVLTAFEACIEGAPEFVDTQMSDIKPILLKLLDDPDAKVRSAAVGVTKEIAECLPEALGKDHQQFMPALAKNLNAGLAALSGSDGDAAIPLVVNCCAALDGIAPGLEEEVLAAYLPDLVSHISKLFSHPELRVKAAAIGAIGSIAESAKESFAPFFKDTMSAFSPYIRIKDSEDELTLRAIAVDAMGDIALAVGAEPFQPYVQPLMDATEEGLHLDNPRVKESSYMLWGVLAKVYKTDFKPFLPGAVKAIFEALQQKESELDLDLGEEAGDLVGSEVVIAGKKVKVVNGDGGEDQEIEDIELDEDDDDLWADIAGISPISEEKEIAAEALAEIFSNVGREFMPYYEDTIKLVHNMIDSPHDGARKAAISALYRAYATIWEVTEQKWEPGLPLKYKPSAELAKLAELITTQTLTLWMAEDESHVVLEINRNLAETLKLTGPALIAGEGVVEQVCTVLLKILTKKHICQEELGGDDDDDDDDLESSEDEAYLIETALDAMNGLAAALGSQFGEIWKMFEKIVLGFASSTESSQRSLAVGVLADAVRGMGDGVTPYTTGLLRIILRRLSDEDSQVKSNAAYAAGILVEKSGSDKEIVEAYPTILGKLEPLLQATESRQLDNAAGCVSRMISKHPDQMQLGDVVPHVVKLLPLKEDYEENAPVYSMIVKLYQSGDSTIQNLTPELMPVISKVMGPPKDQLDDKTREQLVELVKYVHSKNPQSVSGHQNLMALV